MFYLFLMFSVPEANPSIQSSFRDFLPLGLGPFAVEEKFAQRQLRSVILEQSSSDELWEGCLAAVSRGMSREIHSHDMT